jgi:hypothetical protein
VNVLSLSDELRSFLFQNLLDCIKDLLKAELLALPISE